MGQKGLHLPDILHVRSYNQISSRKVFRSAKTKILESGNFYRNIAIKGD